MTSPGETLVYSVPNSEISLQEVERSGARNILQHIGRLASRTALSLSLAIGGGAAIGTAAEMAEPHPSVAMADTGGYPDWDKVCVVGDPKNPSSSYGKRDGEGKWCEDYSWGYFVKDKDGHIIGNVQDSPRGYGYRNCTDWVAWRIPQLVDKNVPRGWGHAKYWDDADKAGAAGFTVDTTPEPGDIAIWNDGTFGHAEVVESVNADGSVNTSGYNKDQNGVYKFRQSVRADDYIDLNGTGKGLNGQDLGGGVPSQPPADLYEIQNWNSPSGMTEVKELPAANSYGQWGDGYVTNDSWHPGSDVDYGMGDFNGDGSQDVIKVQHGHTASGMTEVRVFNGAGRFGAGNPLPTPDGLHGANDVSYVVADYNRDGRPDIYRLMHWNTGSGKTEVRVLDGATNYATWLTGTFVTPDGWHGGDGVDYVASTCGTTNHPNLYVVLHQGTNQGKTEIKRLNGNNNYASWNGGWNSVDGEHSGEDASYTAGGCNENTGHPDIYLELHKNTPSGATEVKRMNGGLSGDASFSQWNGGWVTPDGQHSGNDVDFVMAQRNN